MIAGASHVTVMCRIGAAMEKYENLGMIGEGSYGMVMKCRHKVRLPHGKHTHTCTTSVYVQVLGFISIVLFFRNPVSW